jgi:hypothetical protein
MLLKSSLLKLFGVITYLPEARTVVGYSGGRVDSVNISEYKHICTDV